MPERYVHIIKNERQHISIECPITLEAYALLNDTKEKKVIGQLKFKNYSNKEIAGLVVSIKAYDQLNECVEEIEQFQYAGLSVAPNAEFGSKKPVQFSSGDIIRDMVVTADSVIFKNGEMWSNAEETPFVKREVQNGLIDQFSSEQIKQYQLLTSEQSRMIPVEYSVNQWGCSCGEYNSTEQCQNCGVSRKTIFKYIDTDQLLKDAIKWKYDHARILMAKESIDDQMQAIKLFNELDDYEDSRDFIAQCEATIEKIKELNRQEEEAAQKKKQEEELKAQLKKKKSIRTIFIILGAVLLVAAAIIVYIFVITPAMKYSNAEKLLVNRQYDEAHDAFIALGDYKDSGDRAKDALYAKADQFEENQEFDEANKIFTALGDYRDCNDRILENRYLKAVFNYESGSYFPAADLFKKILDYKDSEEKYQESIYLYGKNLLETNEYTKAIDTFSSLDIDYQYKDSHELKLDAMYGYVKANMEYANPLVYDYLQELISEGYQDSAELINEIKQWGILLLAFNNSEKDSSSTKVSIKRSDCFHFKCKVIGTVPREVIKTLSYRIVLSDGEVIDNVEEWTNCKDGTIVESARWFTRPDSIPIGTMTIKIYIKETNEEIGSISILLE